MSTRITAIGLVAAGLVAGAMTTAQAEGYRRVISYQNKQDLFYNNYEGPNPSGVPVAMYPAPRPVPVHVGHTYYTYQPFYPQEYLYKHTRSHYAYQPGCGWSRAKIRYKTGGLWLDHWWWNMKGDADIFPHE